MTILVLIVLTIMALCFGTGAAIAEGDKTACAIVALSMAFIILIFTLLHLRLILGF